MAAGHGLEEAAWVYGHAHEPNPLPPAGGGDFVVRTPDGEQVIFTVAALAQLPYTEVEGCLIVSTGHGTSGPFTFGGVRLDMLLAYVLGRVMSGQAAGPANWRQVDVISADGFGTRLTPADLASGRPTLLAYRRDGQPLTRAQGLVRLVAPDEHDDALRQVKWVARVELV
jgi:DMSO/TMAO reductase YedYZ molybdopterin-dependent catalytic subunit